MNRVCLFALATIALAGCASILEASLLDSPETKALILSKAKADSAKFCSRSKNGCEMSIYRTRAGWTVHADLLFQSANGQLLGGVGTDKYFTYDNAGHFQGAIDGL